MPSVLSVNTFGVPAGSSNNREYSSHGLRKAGPVWEDEVCVIRSLCAHSSLKSFSHEGGPVYIWNTSGARDHRRKPSLCP